MRAWGLLAMMMVTGVHAAEPVLIPYPLRAEPTPVRADDVGRRAFELLGAAYTSGKQPDLTALTPDALAALVVQAIADEQNGRTPWQASPFWGDSGTSTAREIRRAIAALAEQRKLKGDDALSLAKALLDDGLPSSREAGLKILERTKTNASKAVLAERAARQKDYGPIVDRAVARLYPVLSKDAPFVQLIGERGAYGYVIEDGATSLRVLTWFGTDERFEKAKIKVQRVTLREAAADLVKIQKLEREQQADRLSRAGMLTGQFQSDIVSLPELLVAGWLRREGLAKVADVVMQEPLAKTPDIRVLEAIACEGLGGELHERMLIAWTHARDDKSALAMAKLLGSPLFDGYAYQERSAELAAQLEARMNEEPLPTIDAWKVMQAKLSRAEQVAFLVHRLRAINAIQWGQPGGVSYEEQQYAEPITQEKRPTRLVNPLVELMAMRLGPADLSPNIPWLADSAYMRMYSYWRDFHPARELHRSNAALAWVVNETMQMQLVDLRTFDGLTSLQRVAEIARIAKVIEERKDVSPRELLRARIRAATTMYDLGEALSRAGQDKDPELVALIVAREKDFPNEHSQLAQHAFLAGDAKALPVAERWLKDRSLDSTSRVWAGLIVLQHRGEKTPPQALSDLLRASRAEDGRLIAFVIDRIRRAKLDPGCGFIDTKNGGDGDYGASQPALEVLRRVLQCPGAIDRVVAAIHSTEVYGYTTGELNGQRVEITQTWGDQAAAQVNDWRKDAPEWQVLLPDDQRAKARSEIETWVVAEAGRVAAGKPTMRSTQPTMPLPWNEQTTP